MSSVISDVDIADDNAGVCPRRHSLKFLERNPNYVINISYYHTKNCIGKHYGDTIYIKK